MSPPALREAGGDWLEVGIFADVEVGTGLVDVRQFVMTDDLGGGVVGLQTDEQGTQGLLLSRGTGVGIATLWVEAALVADADAVLVVVAGMGTDHGF